MYNTTAVMFRCFDVLLIRSQECSLWLGFLSAASRLAAAQLNKEVISYQLELRKKPADVNWMLQSSSEWKAQTVLLIAMHYWGTCHWRSWVGDDCSSLPASSHSGPATRDFQSPTPVEALLWGCHLDVQGLLHLIWFHCGMYTYTIQWSACTLVA